MRDILIPLFLMLLLVAIIIVGGSQAILTMREYTRQECVAGYFWSFKDEACVPGYRPSELGR